MFLCANLIETSLSFIYHAFYFLLLHPKSQIHLFIDATTSKEDMDEKFHHMYAGKDISVGEELTENYCDYELPKILRELIRDSDEGVPTYFNFPS